MKDMLKRVLENSISVNAHLAVVITASITAIAFDEWKLRFIVRSAIRCKILNEFIDRNQIFMA